MSHLRRCKFPLPRFPALTGWASVCRASSALQAQHQPRIRRPQAHSSAPEVRKKLAQRACPERSRRVSAGSTVPPKLSLPPVISTVLDDSSRSPSTGGAKEVSPQCVSAGFAVYNDAQRRRCGTSQVSHRRRHAFRVRRFLAGAPQASPVRLPCLPRASRGAESKGKRWVHGAPQPLSSPGGFNRPGRFFSLPSAPEVRKKLAQCVSAGFAVYNDAQRRRCGTSPALLSARGTPSVSAVFWRVRHKLAQCACPACPELRGERSRRVSAGCLVPLKTLSSPGSLCPVPQRAMFPAG